MQKEQNTHTISIGVVVGIISISIKQSVPTPNEVQLKYLSKDIMPRNVVNPLVVGGVIGDVLDPFTNTVSLSAIINNKEISNGCQLRPSQLVNPPRINVGGDDLRTFYTLVMVDADAPSPSNPSLKEYLHWMVTDIPATTNASFGKEMVFYESPKPSAGIHRLVIVLLKQLGRDTVFAPDWRHNFNTRNFAEINNLVIVSSLYFHCHRERGCGGRRC